MITRCHAESEQKKRVQHAKDELTKRGYSQRAAAKYLGYSWNHFSMVLNGRRESRTLLAAIQELPVRNTTIPQRLAMPGRSAAI